MKEVDEIPNPGPARPLRVGITYNLKKNIASDIEDIEAEYDSIETVLAIKDALETGGYQVELMEATDELPEALRSRRVDIVFNIAEGIQGRGREAQVPAILNFYRVPFTGSDETTLCLALDKALAKRLLGTYRIRTPRYKILTRERPEYRGGLRFPVIVKPNAEGSSKGITDFAIAENPAQLRALASGLIGRYRQDLLVEEYIDGREFTVGVVGNGSETHVYPPMEIKYVNLDGKYPIYSYNVKKNYKRYIAYECPAALDEKTNGEILRSARKIYDVLGCRDFARLDFRLSAEGLPYFIEINPLPGLAPGYSDFPMLAEKSGTGYADLVCGVLESALKRYGLAVCPKQG